MEVPSVKAKPSSGYHGNQEPLQALNNIVLGGHGHCDLRAQHARPWVNMPTATARTLRTASRRKGAAGQTLGKEGSWRELPDPLHVLGLRQ